VSFCACGKACKTWFAYLKIYMINCYSLSRVIFHGKMKARKIALHEKGGKNYVHASLL
jgi:hypothetical protein